MHYPFLHLNNIGWFIVLSTELIPGEMAMGFSTDKGLQVIFARDHVIE